MGRKRAISGLSFSWKRATGLSAAKGKLSRQLGMPLTSGGDAEFWWKTAAVNVVPKLAIAAVLALQFDDDEGEDTWRVMWLRALQRGYLGMTEYDRTNYLPVPIGIDEAGNTVYVRLPRVSAPSSRRRSRPSRMAVTASRQLTT